MRYTILGKILLIFTLYFIFIPDLYAQRVGLVLSGGGAKGLTHIGIVRALEENDIPIDYVTGTSMGAIIGSLYAMGYSADDMMELIGSEDFKRWYSGQVEEDYMYYFKKNRPTPELFSIRMSFRDSISIKPLFLPTSVVNPIQMNLVFIDLFAGATAASGGDFDRLFVPFRSVASDIYHKKQIVFRSGDLGDAVRASMSFPFVFRPIEIDGVLAYDGGIYNNFPTDVMQQDFHPDIMIGSVVAKNPTKPDETDLMSQLENMIMQHTDYTLSDSLGILLTFQYDDVNLLDFDRMQELHDIGYNKTMEMMDSIKSRIPRRVTADNVRLRRLVYRSTYPDLRFKNIFITGANLQQQEYIKREFRRDDDDIFTYEEFKRGYFRLLSGNVISEIIPHVSYSPIDDMFDLYLNVKLEDNLAIHLGGNVSTVNNQIYLGVTYQDLNYYAKEFTLDGQIGKVYNNVQFMAKMDFATEIPISYRLIASFSSFDYFKQDRLFSNNSKPAFTKKDEQFVKLKMAVPFLQRRRAELGFGIAGFEDRYFQSSVINFEKDRYDKSSYFLVGGSLSFNGSTLNSRQFANRGYSESLVAQIYTGRERFYPGNKLEDDTEYKENQAWLQLSYTRDQYHRMTRKFTLGWYVDALYSSKNFSENYTATLMQAGEFAPTSHSKLTYNEAFRANQYIGAGIKPIYNINDMLHVRGEFYGFLPIFPIERNSINKPYYGKAFSKIEWMNELSLVFRMPFGAVSAYINNYSSPAKEWNVGLTLGWQLFNYRFIE